MIFFTLNNLTLLGELFLFAFIFILISCALVVPMFAWLAELGGKLWKKAFWDKFAGQILGLSGYAFLGLIVVAAATYLHFPELARLQNIFWFKCSLGALLTSVILLLVYKLSFKKSKQQKWLHILLGGFGILSVKASFWTLVFAWSIWQQKIKLPTENVLEGLSFILWAMLLGAASAGAASGAYVLAKRKKDDFGRDYYRFAVPFCFKAAIFLFVLHFLSYLSPQISHLPFEQNTYLLASAATAGLLTIVLWKKAAFHANPISQKTILLLGSLAFFCFLCLALHFQTDKIRKWTNNTQNETIKFPAS